MATRKVPNTFDGLLEEALKHIKDARTLEKESPLAAPYFLGDDLSHFLTTIDTISRGEVLQQLLIESALAIHGPVNNGQRDTAALMESLRQKSQPEQRILYWHYMAAERPNIEDIAQNGYLGHRMSRAEYYRTLKKAHKQFRAAFLDRIKPALRLRVPRAQPLFGRDADVATCLQAFEEKKTVALTGLGGVGKTALGRTLAANVRPRPVFWFTMRPGLNDRLEHLLFSLGYFLHDQLQRQKQGGSLLWLQLIANAQEITADRKAVAGLLNRDIENLRLPPLLCFDELDLLRPEREAHAQVLTFLDTLRGIVPLLVIGQVMPLEAEVVHELRGLAVESIRDWFEQQHQIVLPADHLKQLQNFTHGNPRMIEAFVVLYRYEDADIVQVLQALPAAPSLEFLLDRIWNRLNDAQTGLLMELAVFPQPAPQNFWPSEQHPILQDLIERQLIDARGHGSVELVPAFREHIYARIPPDRCRLLHQRAALIHIQYGEYTAAASHFICGQLFQDALWLWHEHQDEEIGQGQAPVALDLFQQVAPETFPDEEDRQAYAVLQATLAMRVGDYGVARKSLAANLRYHPTFKAVTERISGDLADLQGATQQAKRHYHASLHALEHLIVQQGRIRRDLSWLAFQERDMDDAWRQALQARCDAESMQGLVQQGLGNYPQARAHYEQALSCAEAARYDFGIAKAHEDMAFLLAMRGEIEPAVKHWEAAYQYYQQTAYLRAIADAFINRAYICQMGKAYQEALTWVEKGAGIFQQLGDNHGLALVARTRAELHLALGNLDEAEQYANELVRTEEDGPMPDGLRVIGEVHAMQQRFAEAERYIQSSIHYAQDNQDRYLEAYGWRALGRMYAAQGRDGAAQEARARAIALFEQLALPNELQDT